MYFNNIMLSGLQVQQPRKILLLNRIKSGFYAAIYGQMRKGVIPHAEYIKPDKLEEITKLDFVFISIDDNETKRWLLPALEAQGVAFI